MNSQLIDDDGAELVAVALGEGELARLLGKWLEFPVKENVAGMKN